MTSEIPKQMKAARITQFKKPMACETMDVPSKLEGHECLIKIAAAGWCHTDLQVLEGVYESQGAHPGLVGSHEPAGTIVALGADAQKEGKLKIGDRVGSTNTFGYCGECQSCRQGKQLCENIKGLLGLTVDGGFAQFARIDARVATRIPDSIDFVSAAPLFCAGATVYGALMAADLKKGQWIAIVGCGGLGHLGVQYAKAMGLNVVAVDNRQEGLDVLKKAPEHLQPDETRLIDSDKSKESVAKELGGAFHETNAGVDRVVICAEDKELVRWSQKILRKGGIIVDVGLPADGPFLVDSFALNFCEQQLRGRLICSPEEIQSMLKLHADNSCVTYVEKTYRVEEINDMIEHYKSKTLMGRLVMDFQ